MCSSYQPDPYIASLLSPDVGCFDCGRVPGNDLRWAWRLWRIFQRERPGKGCQSPQALLADLDRAGRALRAEAALAFFNQTGNPGRGTYHHRQTAGHGLKQ